jgi:hypothetical protein
VRATKAESPLPGEGRSLSANSGGVLMPHPLSHPRAWGVLSYAAGGDKVCAATLRQRSSRRAPAAAVGHLRSDGPGNGAGAVGLVIAMPVRRADRFTEASTIPPAISAIPTA